MTTTQPRPGQATLAGALIVGGSVFVVLAAWQRISTLHTLEVQQELERVLGDPVATELGLSVDGLGTLIRVLCLIGAGAATASAILGLQVFKRSASARIALTALAPLLFVGGLATAGFLAPMVLAGIALLWLQPTRDWYAGRPWVQRYEQRRAARLGRPSPPAGPAAGPPAGPTAGPPAGPTTGPTGPQQPSAETRPAPQPAAAVPPRAGAPAARPAPASRPPALVAACVLTCVLAVMVVLAVAAIGAYASANSERLFAEVMRDQPAWLDASQVTERDLVAGIWLLVAGAVAAALGAVVLAVLAFLGQNWARMVLAVLAAGGAVLALVLALGAWPLLVLVAACAGTTGLLLRPEVARWYAGR